MSWTAIVHVMSTSKAQPASAKLLLLVIAYHLNHDTELTRLSQRTLVAETGLSERTIRRLIDALEASGQLLVERRVGRGHAHVYRLPQKAATMTGFPPQKAVTVSPKGGHSGPQKAVTITALPKDGVSADRLYGFGHIIVQNSETRSLSLIAS